MSLPEFPTITPPLTREDAINQIISSIAMEELALSHIINAEGEKLQYILGTLPGLSGPAPTIAQVLEVNDSVRGILESAAETQSVLRSKLQNALSSPVMRGPTGATGPAGIVEALGIMAERRGNAGGLSVSSGSNIPFNWISDDENPDISFDLATGIFTINRNGVNGYYLVNWSVFIDATTETSYTLTLTVNGIPYSNMKTSYIQTQLSGSALIPAGNSPLEIALANTGTGIISLSDVTNYNSTPSQMTILGFRSVQD